MSHPNVTAIVPSLNPDEKLRIVIHGLIDAGFDDIIVIDDGSDEAHKSNFPSENEFSGLTLLRHEVNRGKGAALKTAFSWFLENRPNKAGVVTADGDNQHRTEDILKCAEEMESTGEFILGVRDFSLPNVPPRSRKGNRITSFVFMFGCGLKISDTQTGLRAIPREFLDRFLKTAGERYEYETNQLLDLKSHSIPFHEVKIATVYIDENQTSHFRVVRDSIRIYKLILKFILSSLTSFFIDIGCFYILMRLFAAPLGTLADAICTAGARAVSSISNFALNKKAVFKNDDSLFSTLVRYYLLAIPQMLVSAGLLTLTTTVLAETRPIVCTLFKCLIDTILFIISYQIQKKWVFKKK